MNQIKKKTFLQLSKNDIERNEFAKPFENRNNILPTILIGRFFFFTQDTQYFKKNL